MSSICTSTSLLGETLNAFAVRNTTTPAQVRNLNPSLATFQNFQVIPVGTYLIPCNSSGARGPPCMYTVRQGDTLASLANQLQVTESQLLLTNPVLASNAPLPGDTVLAPNCYVPTSRTYTTVAGDTLQSIANKFNVNVTNLQAINQLGNQSINLPFRSGRVLVIPTGGVVPSNTCELLLANARQYLTSIGVSATVQIVYVTSGSVLIPALVVINPSNVNPFSPLTPINTVEFPPEEPFVGGTAIYYSLDRIQDFLTARSNQSPLQDYNCAAQRSYEGRVTSREGISCQSILDLFREYLNTAQIPTYGIRQGGVNGGQTIVIRVRIPGTTYALPSSVSSVPFSVTRETIPTTLFPNGYTNVVTTYDDFATFLANNGVIPCEAEGGIVPPDNDCEEFLTLLRRALASGFTNTTQINNLILTIGAVSLRTGITNIQVPVVFIVGYPSMVNPFAANGTANAYLQPLSLNHWRITSPAVTNQLQNAMIYDMASVIAWLASEEVNFTSQCAAALSAELNPNCLGLLGALNTIANSGDRLASFHARRTTVNLRRVLNPDTAISNSDPLYEYGLTLMNRYNPRPVTVGNIPPGGIINIAAVIELGDLINYQSRQNLPTCNLLTNNQTLLTAELNAVNNGLIVNNQALLNAELNNGLNNNFVTSNGLIVNNGLNTFNTGINTASSADALFNAETAASGGNINDNNAFLTGESTLAEGTGFNNFNNQFNNQFNNGLNNNLNGLILNNQLNNQLNNGSTTTINGNQVTCQENSLGQYVCYITNM